MSFFHDLLFSKDICGIAVSHCDNSSKVANSVSSHQSDQGDVVHPFLTVLSTKALCAKTGCTKSYRLLDTDKLVLKFYKPKN